MSKNRKCYLDHGCLYDISNKVVEFVGAGELGGVPEDFSTFGGIHRQKIRSKAPRLSVNTISLNDLLIKYNAPTNIDYISLDTEGSEYKILSSFDFARYHVQLWTIEHNKRGVAKLANLMMNAGYQVIMEKIDLLCYWPLHYF